MCQGGPGRGLQGPQGPHLWSQKTWALPGSGLSRWAASVSSFLQLFQKPPRDTNWRKYLILLLEKGAGRPELVGVGVSWGELRYDSTCPHQGGPDQGARVGDIWLWFLEKLPCAQPNNASWLFILRPGRGSAGEALSEEGVGMTDLQEFHTPGKEPCPPGSPR